MKRPTHRLSLKSAATLEWVRFITLVLAFIGLWQMASGGLTLLNRWF